MFAKIYLYIQNKKLEKQKEHRKTTATPTERSPMLTFWLMSFNFFFLQSVWTSLFFYLFKMGYCSILCFFLNLAIDCELFPMDELLLKIDVPVEAARPWASRFMTIFLFYKLGGGVGDVLWPPKSGKHCTHISLLEN